MTAIAYEKEIPQILQAVGAAHGLIDRSGFSKHLRHLVELRASQINQCGYCVRMHTAEAREDGETNDRLDRLVVWAVSDDFTDAEKSALAWTEAVTVLDRKTDYAVLRRDLKRHFSDKEISVLTAAIAMINFWNRVQVSNH